MENAAIMGNSAQGALINEGFNVMLDYYGKLRCRVFVEDPSMRLSDEVVNKVAEKEEETPAE